MTGVQTCALPISGMAGASSLTSYTGGTAAKTGADGMAEAMGGMGMGMGMPGAAGMLGAARCATMPAASDPTVSAGTVPAAHHAERILRSELRLCAATSNEGAAGANNAAMSDRVSDVVKAERARVTFAWFMMGGIL